MFPPVYTEYFPLLPGNVMISVILDEMNDLSLLLFDNIFIYWKISLVVDTFHPEGIVYC